ncbi:CotO family spore coat protein [Schinkia azotoformans]|uniref:CotO family spore coat protein n=1 Tax=Schinkia azotoformans TaxID=1454 RepID=UPI002DBD6CE2|nr:CotO family spore coat protein [Schinkia azotoformans]MEC1769900.1 CotO family spore coat protein [Schinkia azotoformans]MED4367180.1 CotO family spore coat protein [Schinkia azotoformans]
MERKIVDTINNPLLYITQPVYPTAKPKMQQTYVRRTSTPKYETAQASPVQDEVVEKQVPVDAIAEDITAAPLKKSPIETKTAPKKSRIEENKQPIETHLKVETEPIKEIIEDKPQPKNNVMTVSQEVTVNTLEPLREPIINKVEPTQEPFKSITEPKQKSIKSISKIKRKSIKSIAETKREPVQSIAETKQEPVQSIAETKQEPVKNIIETKKEPVISKVDPKKDESKKDLLQELIKGKLPGLEGIVDGKPVHIQQLKNQVVEQPKLAVPEVQEVIEVPEVSAMASVPEENVFSGEILEVEDKEFAEKIEAAKEKRRMITTFGIRSSIEKGRKAVAAPKKNPLPSPITINDIKNRTPKEQNVGEDVQQVPQNQQEEAPVQQEPEVKKPRKKTFKEMSVEEKVDYLVKLPIAVPKVKCEIRTKESTFQGIIAGYTNGVVQIVQRKKPFRIDLKIEDILGINRKSF